MSVMSYLGKVAVLSKPCHFWDQNRFFNKLSPQEQEKQATGAGRGLLQFVLRLVLQLIVVHGATLLQEGGPGE